MDKKLTLASWIICIVSAILAIAALFYAHTSQVRK